MQVRCVIGSLRLNDGTEYSKGDIFSFGDEILLQTLLASGYVELLPEQVQSAEPKVVKVKQEKVESTPVKVKRRTKRKYGTNNKL